MITIIGGGPIGCYTASMLAKKKEVIIYEENKEVGSPIQCTGILTDTINNIVKVKKDFVANRIYSARIHSPNGEHMKINFKKPNIIVYRDKFDQYFRDLAERNGAEIIHNHRFTGKNEVQNLNTKKKRKIHYDLLIGADGPLSKVSQEYGLGKRKYLLGVQALVKKKNDNTVDFHPYIGAYAWAVPQTENILRVGVAAEKNSMKIFKEFSKKYKGKILGWQGGLIPIHNPKIKASKYNVFLVGDAAAQIKNTTGGGLIPGLMCAEELSKAINREKDYDKLWKKRVGKKLWAHYMARKVMNKFTDDDWNEAIAKANKPSIKEVLGSVSRDEPLKIARKIIFKEPSIISFVKKLL